MGFGKKIIKIGVNGAGGVGFQIIKNLHLQGNNNANVELELVAINEPSAPIESIAVLFNHLLPGRQQHVFQVEGENTLQFGQKSVIVLAIREPAEIPWAAMGVEYVIDSTGSFTVKAKAAAHLKGGAKKVIITDISKDVPMYVFGVNEKEYKPEDNIVSSASCITHHLAPILEVLHAQFGILECDINILDSAIATQYDDGPIMTGCEDRRLAFFDLIPNVTGGASAAVELLQFLNESFGIFGGLTPALHTTSNVIKAVKAAGNFLLNVGEMLGIDDDLRTTLIKLLSTSAEAVDGPHGASSSGNIPADIEAVGKVLAYLYGKLTGSASHGPTTDGSIVVLNVRLQVEATLEHINAAIKKESEGKFKDILGYTEDDHSRDLLGDRRSSIFNAMPTACSALDNNHFKFIFYCNNQWGYSCRVIDLILYMDSANEH